MTNPSTIPSKLKYKWSNIEQLLLLLEQLKAHHVIVFIKTLAENLWQIDDDLVRYFSSIKLQMDSCPHTFSHI